MPRIRLDKFAGQLPALNPHKLPDRNSQLALNVKVWSGSLKPMRQVDEVKLTTLENPAVIFRYDENIWFESEQWHDVIRSPSINDEFRRVYFTGPLVFGMRVSDSTMIGSAPVHPEQSRLTGVPAPTVAPTVAVSGSGSGLSETRFYLYTAVNAWGEEGPPSPVSDSIVVSEGQTVSVSADGVDAGDYHTIASYRIYRSNNSGTSYQFVGETAVSPFLDSTFKFPFGQEELPSAEWDPPPTDIQGLVVTPNGVVVGFRKNEVLFSEPGLPYAWPVRYRISLEYNVVRLGLVENGVAVLTDGQPYLILGSHPGSMTSARLNVPFACTSARGAAQIGNAIIYPCPRGLALIDSSGARIISDLVFDDDDWLDFKLDQFISFHWRGLFVSFFQRKNEERGGFLLNPISPEAGIVTFGAVEVHAGFEDLGLGKLYLVINGRIVEWDAGVNLTYVYKSRPYEQARPAQMSVLQVMAEEYPVICEIYRDGELQDRVQVGENLPRRIAGAALGRIYEVQVISDKEVREVVLASSMREIGMV